MAVTDGGIGTIIAASAERAPWGWALLGTVLIAVIRAWPILRKMGIAERRDDLDAMGLRVTDLEKRVEAALTAAHVAEMKLVYAVNAVQLLAVRVRADSPDDPALAQAMELLSAATTGGMPSWSAKFAAGVNAMREERE